MATRVKQAIADAKGPTDVAMAAVQDAVSDTTSNKEKEDLAAMLYKEATGRFPQNSNDRMAVYLGGFILVAVVFLAVASLTLVLVLHGRDVPVWIGTLTTALVSGVIGGLFGYAQS